MSTPLSFCDISARYGHAPSAQRSIEEQTGWNRNTTYTVIKKLIEKGAVERYEPNFTCRAMVTKDCVRQGEATELIDKLFDGSAELFLSAYVSGKKLSSDEIDGLRRIVEELK